MKTISNTKEAKTFEHKKKVFRKIKGSEKRWEVVGYHGWEIASPARIKRILEK